MRLGIDYTAAARQGAGIGRHTRELVSAVLAEETDHDVVLMVGTAGLGERWAAEAARLKALAAPDRLTLRAIPLSDAWMARIWHRLRLPLPANLITGPIDLFYAPDFLLPPLAGPVKTMITIHDLSFLRHPETFPEALRRYLEEAVPRSARSADHITTDSDATRRDVIELLDIPPEKVTTLHLGVSSAFSPSNPEGIPLTDEGGMLLNKYNIGGVHGYVLAVGTVQPRKNYLRLIEAVDLVRKEEPIELVIAGKPAWLSDPVVEAAQARPYVHLLGFVDDADLPALYRHAWVFAFPSLYEGFGLPPLEAMACGTPVVASNASSIPEAVGDAGVLVDPLDVQGWADAIFELATHKQHRRTIIELGLERAATFTWARMARRWLALAAQITGTEPC